MRLHPVPPTIMGIYFLQYNLAGRGASWRIWEWEHWEKGREGKVLEVMRVGTLGKRKRVERLRRFESGARRSKSREGNVLKFQKQDKQIKRPKEECLRKLGIGTSRVQREKRQGGNTFEVCERDEGTEREVYRPKDEPGCARMPKVYRPKDEAAQPMLIGRLWGRRVGTCTS
jgi:hypothetical protein